MRKGNRDVGVASREVPEGSRGVDFVSFLFLMERLEHT